MTLAAISSPTACHRLTEGLAVLRTMDGVGSRADQLDAFALEDARVVQLHGQVECGLSAEGRQQRVRVARER